MIAFADDSQIRDVIHIWKTSFPDDSQQFMDMYFQKKYKNENTLLYFAENKAVSCLQMLPYDMTFYNTICQTSYISGAATLPEYKNRGIMGNLLTASFAEMIKRGNDFTTLIPQEPWLVGFYQKQGYTPCFEYCLNPILINEKIENQQYTIIEMSNANTQVAFRYYSEYCKKQNLFVLKSYQDFLIIWEDLQLASGTIFLCLQSDVVCGIAFCFPSNEKLIVKDAIAETKEIEKQLIQAAKTKYPKKETYSFKQVDDNQKSVSLAMARILHVNRVLERYAAFYPQLRVVLQITDYQIEQNNGIFQIEHGKCTRLEGNNYDFSIDIALLTQLLMGYQTDKLPSQYSIFPSQHPYMSLMLD